MLCFCTKPSQRSDKSQVNVEQLEIKTDEANKSKEIYDIIGELSSRQHQSNSPHKEGGSVISKSSPKTNKQNGNKRVLSKHLDDIIKSSINNNEVSESDDD